MSAHYRGYGMGLGRKLQESGETELVALVSGRLFLGAREVMVHVPAHEG